MMRFSLLLMAGLAMAQTPAPQFEVATIKPPAPQPNDGHTHSRMSVDNNRLLYANVTLKDALAQAYNVQRYQVSGPDWIDTDRFDIQAKIPEGKRAQVPEMLQNLLADRFGLKIHRETKELPVYALVVAKGGPKFKAAESQGLSINSNRTHWHVEAKVSMQRLAELLSEDAGRPVIDRTGLMGSYDMTLDWAVDDAAAANDPAAGPSLFTALQEQLGLRLESTRAPVETIIVDQAQRTPVEN